MKDKRRMRENRGPYETTIEHTISDRFYQPIIGKIDMSITLIVYRSSTIMLGSCKRESTYNDQHVVWLRQNGR